ncbi:MAG: hypothetical protein ACK5KQ_04850 [Anaerorhabdus sp.]
MEIHLIVTVSCISSDKNWNILIKEDIELKKVMRIIFMMIKEEIKNKYCFSHNLMIYNKTKKVYLNPELKVTKLNIYNGDHLVFM